MTAQELLKEIDNLKTTSARNSMGCSENWYNAYYAIAKTFSTKEIEEMTEREVDYLLRLGDALAEAFY